MTARTVKGPAWYRRECADHDRALAEPMQPGIRFAGEGMTKAERNARFRQDRDRMTSSRTQQEPGGLFGEAQTDLEDFT